MLGQLDIPMEKMYHDLQPYTIHKSKFQIECRSHCESMKKKQQNLCPWSSKLAKSKQKALNIIKTKINKTIRFVIKRQTKNVKRQAKE